MENKLAELVKKYGEKDENTYRIWLDLNGVCDLDGHTDIMCAHLGEDGILTFQVNTPDDKSSYFVRLQELPKSVIGLVNIEMNNLVEITEASKPRLSSNQGKAISALLKKYMEQDNCCFDFLANEKVPADMTFEEAFEVYVGMMQTIEDDRFLHIRDFDDISEYKMQKDGRQKEEKRYIGIHE